MKVCIIGLGYIGLPTACMFSTHGIEVVGVDSNLKVLKKLQGNQLHIFEPGLEQLFSQAIQDHMLSFSSTPQSADAFIIAVPTPFKDGKKADMSYVESAARSIIPVLQKGNLVVLESTSPPGTTMNLVRSILDRDDFKAGENYDLCYSPERVLPGNLIYELEHNARVIGGINTKASDRCAELYSVFVKGEMIKTTPTTAEMVKLMENTYRDVNIAIANEFALISEEVGIDVNEAIRIANHHPRVKILNPGPGVGGHCISVDPWFLVETAPSLSRLILTARQVNDHQPLHIVHKIKDTVGSLTGVKVGILGLSYKPDIDDFRESPSMVVIEEFIKEAVEIHAHDPYFGDNQLSGVIIHQSLDKILNKVDVLLILVGHQLYRNTLLEKIETACKGKIIYDAVNILPQNRVLTSNRVIRLGVGSQESNQL